MKIISYSIITINNLIYNEVRSGIIVCFYSNYNEYNIKSSISFVSGIPIGEIKQLYYKSISSSLYKYNNYSFSVKSRIYAEVSSSYLHLSSDIDKLKDKNEYLEKKIESINREHDITFLNLKRNYENLEREEQYRKEMQQREEQKINNFKVAFEKSKKNIEKINLEKSKEYITKWIVNKFVKEFDNEEGKKNSFTISLIEFMKDLNKEYMEYCSKFISSFKANGQKIVNDFNIKDNKFLN